VSHSAQPGSPTRSTRQSSFSVSVIAASKPLIEERPWLDVVLVDGRFESPSSELTWAVMAATAGSARGHWRCRRADEQRQPCGHRRRVGG
jgi:hypothetical protein